MKPIALACLGVVGLAATLVSFSTKANAQQETIDPKKLPDLFSSAPAGGITMLQDKDSVYIYDGKSQKLIVVTKNTWEGENLTPKTRVINIAKAK